MTSNQELKNRALANLARNWGNAIIVTLVFAILFSALWLIYSILTMNVQMFDLNVVEYIIAGVALILALVLLHAFVFAPLLWGFSVMFLDFIRGDKLHVGKLFDGYRNNWMRIFTTYLLTGIYTFFWMLLLYVPGIIKMLSYSMTPFILKDNPELSNNAAIEESMDMMDGHKAKLFWLYLSFIGWAILVCLTYYIGFLLLIPYIYTTIAHFYEDLKAEQNG